jgi:hypothetical protein
MAFAQLTYRESLRAGARGVRRRRTAYERALDLPCGTQGKEYGSALCAPAIGGLRGTRGPFARTGFAL